MKKNKKKIAIYGGGGYGREVIRILSKTKQIFITMVCDSDEKKWGRNYEGFVICSPEKIFEEKELDGVFIAVLAENNIEQYILNRKEIKIYKKIHELVAETINWDISGRCNAKCRYCITGYNNRNQKLNYTSNSYMDLELFKKNYCHLYEKGIISKESNLAFYNWKEPFLNPDIIDILSFCSEQDQKYALSTNGSIYKPAIAKNTYSKCRGITFSMPGFSQESYNRIHGFIFENIKKNIIAIKNNMLEHGFLGDFIISAHIYRFNEKEIDNLKEWAKKEGIFVNAYRPYLAGNSLIADYFEGNLSKKTQKEISSDLFLPWEDGIKPEYIQKFVHPLCDQMNIDEKGKLTLCCMADECCECFSGWGKIEDLDSYEDYIKLRKKMFESKTCIQCRKYAMVYRISQVNGWFGSVKSKDK